MYETSLLELDPREKIFCPLEKKNWPTRKTFCPWEKKLHSWEKENNPC